MMHAFQERFGRRLCPSFLIIGAQKAGTSALFRMLAAHPQVLAPAVKEHHFFDKPERVAGGLRAYLKGFPLASGSAGKVTFEATPSYLFHPEVAARIHAMLPDLKLIAVLRDPVRRAFSAWNMFRDMKDHPVHGHLHDPRSFAQAVEDEIEGRTASRAHLYLARGRYAPQLQRYFDLFGRDRVLVLRHAQLDKDPGGVMMACCSFLGLEPYSGDPTSLQVRDNVRPYTEPLDAALRDRLVTYFAPHMAELQALLGPEWDLLGQAR